MLSHFRRPVLDLVWPDHRNGVELMTKATATTAKATRTRAARKTAA